MKRFSIAIIVLAAALMPALPQRAAGPFSGRWDMTVTSGADTYPSWMEVVPKGDDLNVRVQGRTGNVNPAYAVKTTGAKLVVTVSPATPARPAEGDRPAIPARPELVWELTAKDGKLTGIQKRGDSVAQIAGVRAPALKRELPKAWTEPEPLFNGRDLTGWVPINNTPGTENYKNHWVAKDGELVNLARGSNLRTTRVFDDFKLRLEYNCPPGENSGIYLRGRYEAQVTAAPRPQAASARRPAFPSPFPRNPYTGVGSIYGMVGPAAPPPFRPEWQTYEITLVGRWVTVVFNGVTTIDNQEIAGITGGAIDSNEGEPGPIYFQGDHHGGIRYRNITISVPKR